MGYSYISRNKGLSSLEWFRFGTKIRKPGCDTGRASFDLYFYFSKLNEIASQKSVVVVGQFAGNDPSAAKAGLISSLLRHG
jgi:hypothetical protein